MATKILKEKDHLLVLYNFDLSLKLLNGGDSQVVLDFLDVFTPYARATPPPTIYFAGSVVRQAIFGSVEHPKDIDLLAVISRNTLNNDPYFQRVVRATQEGAMYLKKRAFTFTPDQQGMERKYVGMKGVEGFTIKPVRTLDEIEENKHFTPIHLLFTGQERFKESLKQ